MITFDSLTLKAFIEENRDFFIGSRIQKIQQPTRREIILNLRKNGESRKFYININPQFYHLCFINKESEVKRFLEIPQKPPMFCMQLRKYLENAKIVKINQPNYERIFEIYIETYNELQEKIELCLASELMGKHSNIVLYNADTNIIIGCAHNVGSEKSREREMAGTLPYIYPPKQKKFDILNVQGEITESLTEFYFFSKAFANQVKGSDLATLKSYVLLENLCPAISTDYNEFTLYSEVIGDCFECVSVNEMIDKYFSFHIENNKKHTLKSELISLVTKKLSRLVKNDKLMSEQLKKEEKREVYRHRADLIMANLYANKDFSSFIDVFDWEVNQNVKIELDESISLKDNANKFYKLYNKSKRTCEKVVEMQIENRVQIEYLQQTLYAIDRCETYVELLDLKNELIPLSMPPKKEKETLILEKEILGQKVFIGRNNKQNDFIVSKLAKDEDWWFHTHNCAGSHVLLKCENLTDELIFECAKLAKEYSSASQTSKVGVIYTQRKNIKKPPKAPLGYVIYKGEEEIIV